MKNFLLITSFLLFFSSCLENDVYFQGLLFDETIIAPSTVGEPSFSDHDKKETFVLKGLTKPKVDILVSVDSSFSMNAHLKKLGESLSHLLSVIHDYDWQIAFITADHGDSGFFKKAVQSKWQDNLNNSKPRYGRLMPLDNGKEILKGTVLKKGMANYEDIFYHTLSHSPDINCSRPPYCTSSLEQPLRSLKSSIERQQVDNGHFFRPEADLVTLIITNEDERNGKKNSTTARDVISAFENVFSGSKKQFINFNILVKDSICRRQELKEANIANIGIIVGELATLTGGENIDICSEDYGPQLEKISKHIKARLENSLVLDETPLPGSVRIDFGQLKEISWVLEGKKIVFTGKIEKTTPISVYYKVRQ